MPTAPNAKESKSSGAVNLEESNSESETSGAAAAGLEIATARQPRPRGSVADFEPEKPGPADRSERGAWRLEGRLWQRTKGEFVVPEKEQQWILDFANLEKHSAEDLAERRERHKKKAEKRRDEIKEHRPAWRRWETNWSIGGGK